MLTDNGTKISVIIPAYNVAPYLPRCIDSVLSQAHADLEIILVDDGSHDGTGDIIDSYAARDRRIVAIHKTNGGVTRARFDGIRAATGEFIGFVDADDYIEPDMYAHLLQNMLLHKADISICGCWKKETAQRTSPPPQAWNNPEGLFALLDASCIGCALWSKLYRRQLFSDLLRSDMETLEIHNHEDLLMNFYLFRAAEKSVYQDFPAYHHIQREESLTTSKTSVFYTDPLRVNKILTDFCREDKTLLPPLYRRHIHTLITASRQSHYPQISKSAKKELKALLRSPECPPLSLLLSCKVFFSVYLTPLYRMMRSVGNRMPRLLRR